MKQFIVLFLTFCDLVYISYAYDGCYYDSYMYGTQKKVSSDASTPLKCKAYCSTVSSMNLWQFVYTAGSTGMAPGCYCYARDAVQQEALPSGTTLIGGDVRVDNCFYDSYEIGKAVAHDTAKDTPLQCKAWCETIPGSTNYEWTTYTGFWGGCYCMHVDKSSTKTAKTNWGIGGSANGPPALPVPDCFKKGQDYVGGDITKDGLDNIHTATPQRCQAKCAATEGCIQFTWLTNWHCWLKKSIGTPTSYSDAVSGPPSCPVCYYDSYMYGTQKSVSSDASTPLKCKAYCNSTSMDLWQFVYNAGSTGMSPGCYCYDKDAVQQEALPKGVTLIGGDADVGNCFFDSYGIGKAVAHDTAKDTPLQCKAWCETIPGSTNYEWTTYTGFWGGCYCMHVNETSTKTAKTNWGIGGPARGPAPIPVPEDCFKKGQDYDGGDITKDGLDNIHTATPQRCQAKCAATQGCIHFTWLTDWHCWLKKTMVTPTSDSETISGPPSCSEDCYYDSYMYGTQKTVSSDASTPLKCKAYCNTVSYMTLWQFVYKSSTGISPGCYCYDKATAQKEALPKNTKLVGGNVGVDNCFYDSYEIGKAVAHDTAKDTPLQCKAWCETIPGSTNYEWLTYPGFWGGCYCMHVDKTSTKTTKPNFGIGGSVTAPAALPVPDCLKTGQDYVGNDITKDGLDNVFTATAARCQSKCAATEGCVQFVWLTDWHCWLKSAVGTESTNTEATSGPPSCSG